MRWKTLAMVGCAGIAAVAVSGGAARVTADQIQLRALMNAAQEVPAPAGNVANARGTFTAVATKSAAGASLQWRLTFSNLTGDAVAAHIHTGAPGQPGPVSVSLCGPCTSGATGTANIDATLLAALQSGGTYVNVHTPTNRGGEIRAQLGSLGSVRPVLTVRQEVPKPKGAGRAAGRFTATAVKTGSSAVLTWRLTFSKLSGRAVAAHIHLGRRGACGRHAVWPVPERRSRPQHAHRFGPGRARGGRDVRERPHAPQPGRRDPRADTSYPAHDHSLVDDPGAAPCAPPPVRS